MPRQRPKLLLLAKEAVAEWNRDNCLRLGASLSYYTLFSLFPLILVVLTLVRLLLVNSDVARDAILEALSRVTGRSEEHTSELQSRQYLVCRLLLEKKNKSLTAPLIPRKNPFTLVREAPRSTTSHCLATQTSG